MGSTGGAMLKAPAEGEFERCIIQAGDLMKRREFTMECMMIGFARLIGL